MVHKEIYQVNINGVDFEILETIHNTWSWNSFPVGKNGDESDKNFSDAYEAQADAMRYMTDKRIDEELAAEEASNDEKYGTERDQIRDYYNASRL